MSTSKLLLSVVIPAHNEEGNLRRTIDALDDTLTRAEIPHEILVVNDHSTDGTGEMLELLATRYAQLRSVPNLRQPGFGNALNTGLDEFRGDAVVMVMADGSDDPDDIVAYYRKLEEGYECAFGSRFIRGGGVFSYPLHKLILNRIVNLFIKWIFGIPFNDVTNAFKCYRRTVIEGIRPILSHHFNITVELPLKAIVRGYTYAVTPIRWYGRTKGVSKLRIREMGSRYLFIILYVLLEKLLARGDYRRASDTQSAAPSRAGRSMFLPWAAFALVALVHLLFIKTYPLNNLGGDAPGYYWMLTNRLSNLCAAPGYPFLGGLPLSIASIQQFCLSHELGFRSALLVTQHLFDLLCLGIFMIVIARVYNRLTAAITVFIAGMSVQGMAVTSATYPEWMQADFLMLTLSAALLARSAEGTARKAFWYAAAFGAFTWAYLVKFNAAIIFPILLLALLCERVSWRQRARIFAIAAAFAFVNYAAFIVCFHRPKTGTYDLSYDHSWVLMARLNDAYKGKLPYPQGIATKRWLALSGVLPPNYGVASLGPFVSLEPIYVSKPDRLKYRAVATQILTTKDEALLDRIIREHPLPPGFALNISSVPVSWYVGLKESDDLGIKVFWESVLHHPREFIWSTAGNTRLALRDAPVEPLFATTDNLAAFTQKVIPVGSHLRLVQGVAPYRYGDALVWKPGLQLFSPSVALSVMTYKPLLALIFLGFLGAVSLGVFRGWSYRAVVSLVLTVTFGAFIVFSAALLEFRWKEARFALPLLALLVGIFGGWTVPELFHLVAGRLSGEGEGVTKAAPGQS